MGGASIAAMTLMACYGAPMIDECIQLPDGGFEPAWCGDDFTPLDAGGDAPDAGDGADAGEYGDAGEWDDAGQ